MLSDQNSNSKMHGSGCHSDHCHTPTRRDYLLWGSSSLVILGLIGHIFLFKTHDDSNYLSVYSHAVFELMSEMWVGILLGIFFVGLLSIVPREFVMGLFGKAGSNKGLVRATIAGLLLDLCSHGILMVGMKLYERGASLGQVMAFLIASPWNSLSLTIILISLVGMKWTLTFIALSGLIALVSGFIFERLVEKEVLPANPNSETPSGDFVFIKELKLLIKNQEYSLKWAINLLREGLSDSLPIIKWLFIGVVIAGLIRAFVPTEVFSEYFGPSLMGLGLTLLAATIIEVCSEGSTPIAAEIFHRASAPGNAFAFLMTGVSTDYTEIMGIKEKTKSWKIALFLPLVTLPQVVAISLMINHLYQV